MAPQKKPDSHHEGHEVHEGFLYDSMLYLRVLRALRGDKAFSRIHHFWASKKSKASSGDATPGTSCLLNFLPCGRLSTTCQKLH
jgi:hypothetical protein